jgi:hypothetical protein
MKLVSIKARDSLNRVEKFTDWEWFQSLASELISPQLQIDTGKEADKTAGDVALSIALAYRLLTSTLTLSDLHNNLPSLE